MASFVEILQVECVVPNLVNRGAVKAFFSDFEFDHKDNRPNNKDSIDPAPHPRDIELQEQ